jgi:hypothetical protein
MPRHRGAAAVARETPPEAPVSREPEAPPQVEAEPIGAARPSLVAEVLELKRSWEAKKDAAIQEGTLGEAHGNRKGV